MEFSALYPELIVSDLQRSTHFYVDVLGFNIAFSRLEEKFHFLSYGDAQLMLLEDNKNAHSRTGPMEYPRGQGINFSILTPDTATIANALEKHDLPLRIPIREQWHRKNNLEFGQKQLWVMDPDGYLLRFIEEIGSRKASSSQD